MIQQTSLDAYNSITQKKLGQSQQQVYNLLNRYGNLLDSEISIFLDWRINRVTPRRGELVKLGLVVQDPVRECECKWCQNNRKKNIKPVHRKGIGWKVV